MAAACRSINGVGNATSEVSDAELVVGKPGTPGKPTALTARLASW